MALTTVPSAGAQLRASILSALMAERMPTVARMAGDQNLTASNTTLENVTSLVLPVAANATYDGWLIASAVNASAAVEDIKFGFTFPTGAVMRRWGSGAAAAVTASAGDGEWVAEANVVSGTTAIPFGVIGGGVRTSFIVPFTLVISSTSGNLQVQAAQNTSGVNVVTIRLGSKLILHQTG